MSLCELPIFFIGSTLLAAGLEFALGVDVALFVDLGMMTPHLFLFCFLLGMLPAGQTR